jgi:hypothetical protein
MLTAAPRWAVHQALAEREPCSYFAAAKPGVGQLGTSPAMEDAAIAYQLLTEACAWQNYVIWPSLKLLTFTMI